MPEVSQLSYIDVSRVQRMWLSAFVQQVRDHAVKIRAAGEGKKKITFDGQYHRLGSVEQEWRWALEYFNSEDAEELAELAGLSFDIEAIKRILAGEVKLPTSSDSHQRGRDTVITRAAEERRRAIFPKAKELREKGFSCEQIAKALGVSRYVATRAIRDYGVD